MTTFVRLSEEDQAYDLVILLNRINAGVATMGESKGESAVRSAASIVAGDAEEEEEVVDLNEVDLNEAKGTTLGKLVADKKFPDLMNEFLKITDKIFACDDDVADATFSLALSLFKLVATDEAATKDFVSKFSNALTADKTNKAVLRLQLLTVLFNLVDEASPLRFDVLVTVLSYSLATNQAARLTTYLENVTSWSAQWKLDSKQEGKLLELAAQMSAQAGDADNAQHYTFQFLKIVDKEVKGNEYEEAASRLALASLRFSSSGTRKAAYEYDSVMQLAAVQALANSKQHKALHTLLKIFASGTVAEFNAFVKGNPAAAKAAAGPQGEEGLLSTLRTLTICSLGAENERLSYAKLMEALELKSSEEVEELVIVAVTTGRLEAKIDQEKEEVVVQRTSARTFKEEDWGVMAGKLNSWKKNVEQVLATLQSVYQRS